MQTEPVQPLSAQLAQPLNESIREENAGQFALMLSLLYEARVQPLAGPAHSQLVTDETFPVANGRGFNLEMQLNVAMGGDSPAQANLLRGIIAERTEQRLARLSSENRVQAVADPGDGLRRRSGDALLAQLEYGCQQGPEQKPGTVMAAKQSQGLALL